jgi:hypothetical protein
MDWLAVVLNREGLAGKAIYEANASAISLLQPEEDP